jgi:hypothetical protein
MIEGPAVVSDLGAQFRHGQLNYIELAVGPGRLPLQHAALGIGIDHQDFEIPRGQSACQVDGGRGLADPAFLIDQADDHVQCLKRFFLPGTGPESFLLQGLGEFTHDSPGRRGTVCCFINIRIR